MDGGSSGDMKPDGEVEKEIDPHGIIMSALGLFLCLKSNIMI